MYKSSDPIDLVGMLLCALTCVLASMKIEGVISRGWLWVLAPIWIVGVVFILGAVAIVVEFLVWKHKQKSKRRSQNEIEQDIITR